MRRLLQVQRAQRRARVDEHRRVLCAARPPPHARVLVREAQQLERVVGTPLRILVRLGVVEPAVLVPPEMAAVAASQARLEGV